MKQLPKLKKLNRKRLMESLDNTLSVPLFVVTGAMGYGKTTAVREYLDGKGLTNIWFAFEQEDMDDDWIWQRLLKSIYLVKPEMSDMIGDMEFPKTRQDRVRFLKKLECVVENLTVMVLDDCQYYKGSDFFRLVEDAAYWGIPFLHIIVISRTRPPMPYDEMVLKGVCDILEQHQMVLKKEELEEFVTENGLTMTRGELDFLYEYTDGWMAAAYLSLLEFVRNGSFGNPGGINHLMKTSIYDKMPEEYKQILMKLSLFDEFTEDQAAYITEEPKSKYYLMDSVEENCFVKYQVTGHTFEIHSLLRNVAFMELEKSSYSKKELWRRCGRWYEENHNYIRAIQNYYLAGEKKAAFDILERKNGYQLYEKAPNIFYEMFSKISMEEKAVHYKVYFPFIHYYLIYVDIDEGKRLFQKMKEYCEQNKDQLTGRVLGELEIVEAFAKFNDVEAMIESAQKASDLLGGEPSAIFNEEMLTTFGVTEIITLYHNKIGGLRNFLKSSKKYNAVYLKLINGYDAGWEALIEAEYMLGTGNWREAWKQAERAAGKALFGNKACIAISSYLVMMRVSIVQGEKARLESEMKRLAEIIESTDTDEVRMDYELAVSFIYGRIGDTERVADWIKVFDLSRCNGMVRSARSGCATYGLLLLNEKRYQELESLAQVMYKPYKEAVHIVVLITARLYAAIAALHLYGAPQAMEYLMEAIKMAQPDGLKIMFIENSGELMGLYEEISSRFSFIREMLPLCRQYQNGLESFKDNSRELTKREQDILVLMMDGMKNIEISQKLKIANVTVEKNLSSIYRKLGVQSRTAAIAEIKNRKTFYPGT